MGGSVIDHVGQLMLASVRCDGYAEERMVIEQMVHHALACTGMYWGGSAP
jgi:hypothetical protein